MTTVNITGATPNPGRPGKPSDSAARASTQRAGSPADRDYAAAERQRDRQELGESRAWRQHNQREAAYFQEMEKLYAAEIKAHEARLTADQRLMHRFRLLEHRAGNPLTPSSWSAWQRAHMTLTHQAMLHQEKYGSTPFSAAQMSTLRTSVGSENAAYAVGRTLRLGNVGQRAGYERSWTELVRIERELKRIDHTLDRQAKFQRSPTDQANLERQKQALYIARERIAAGLSGNHPAVNRMGRALGLVNLAMRNPITDTILMGAMTTVAMPYTANATYAGLLGMGKQYRDWSIGVRRLGLAGGFSGSGLESMMLRSGPKSYAPGNTLRDELRRFGLSPQDVSEYARQYGVPMERGREVIRYAENVRMASLSAGMNLSEGQLNQLGSQAQHVFNMAPSQYFQKLQKTMALAQREGFNSSQLAQSWSSVLNMMGRSVGMPSIGAYGDWFRRMEQSGSPLMRSGQGEVSYLSGLQNTFANLGGNNAGSIALSLSWARHGGVPTSAAALQRQFGVSSSVWAKMTGTPAGQAALKGYLEAAKARNYYAAEKYAGVILQSAPPGTWSHILHGAGLPTASGLGPIIRANASGVPLATELAAENGNVYVGAANGLPPALTGEQWNMVAKAAEASGLPAWEVAALAAAESGWNWKDNGDHIGYTQMSPAALKAVGMTAQEASTQQGNLIAGAKYLAKMQAQAGGNYIGAMGLYHDGPGSAYARGGALSMEGQADVSRFAYASLSYQNTAAAMSMQRRNALEDTANLAKSRWADSGMANLQKPLEAIGDVAHNVVAGFKDIESAAGSLAKTLRHLDHAFGGAHMPGWGTTNPFYPHLQPVPTPPIVK